MSLLSISELSTHFRLPSGALRALDGVSLDLEAGETLGIVGESGCGKSTLGKSILRLVEPSAGAISFDGEDITTISQRGLALFRRRAQMVFQDPFASLNPRHSIRKILTAPLIVHGIGGSGKVGKAERNRRVEDIVRRVGLEVEALDRYPHEFSGGQRQRIGIARALVLQPDLVICDEPVSALDLSIQAQTLNLLGRMKADLGLSYIFISHDLSVVRYFTDRVMVMYLGRVVESAPTRQLWSTPRHPYTRALMDAVPDPARRRHAAPIRGDLPSPQNLPTGCRFHPRCPLATELCTKVEPPLKDFGNGQSAACHHV
ncbi:ABC transporter ATP-binding protein [Novosphingobium guangzhouense]|uniref:Peptide ABC transporter ATP-binding protein n=1 Tax=Novosphingobium guangzhouense TaxID=1850347 RepID=A0A2K2G3B9_9SPHN|nr:oligopeptide/dipeptide ABC transporter ATP-binding protein [Novosphingobium guangzhouense]PNU05527.1 peptide ABC transporter ATP-binding protein [Novosphingobium guangzhouense]